MFEGGALTQPSVQLAPLRPDRAIEAGRRIEVPVDDGRLSCRSWVGFDTSSLQGGPMNNVVMNYT